MSTLQDIIDIIEDQAVYWEDQDCMSQQTFSHQKKVADGYRATGKELKALLKRVEESLEKIKTADSQTYARYEAQELLRVLREGEWLE